MDTPLFPLLVSAILALRRTFWNHSKEQAQGASPRDQLLGRLSLPGSYSGEGNVGRGPGSNKGPPGSGCSTAFSQSGTGRVGLQICTGQRTKQKVPQRTPPLWLPVESGSWARCACCPKPGMPFLPGSLLAQPQAPRA